MPSQKSTQNKASNGTEVVQEPKASDILCGKDKSCVAHEGSVRFRKIIDQYRERYCSDSTSKQQRMAITKEIVQRLSRSARFLKYDSKDKVWRTITALAARDKVSHALRFANFKENRRTGKIKNVRRRVSASSASSSDSNAKVTSPEDATFWNSLVTRQAMLLESIKQGDKDNIPTTVELPERICVAAPVTPTIIDCDPLSINDSSFEENPTFQDYCLQLYRSEDIAEGQNLIDGTEATDAFKHCEQGEYQTPGQQGATVVSSSSDRCLYEDQSECDDSQDIISHTSDSEERSEEIASMITEPLMEWDLEHDGIFEV